MLLLTLVLKSGLLKEIAHTLLTSVVDFDGHIVKPVVDGEEGEGAAETGDADRNINKSVKKQDSHRVFLTTIPSFFDRDLKFYASQSF